MVGGEKISVNKHAWIFSWRLLRNSRIGGGDKLISGLIFNRDCSMDKFLRPSSLDWICLCGPRSCSVAC